MVKKRRAESNAVGESRPQPTRAVRAAALCVVIAVGLGVAAETQAATITLNQDGSGDYLDIPPVVAAAASGDAIEVAKGAYTGAVITQAVVIHGSGPGTRITTGIHPWGDGFNVYAADVDISNLSIEVTDPWSAGVYAFGADNLTVSNLRMKRWDGWCGIASDQGNNLMATDNIVAGVYYESGIV